jgi:hypothetical protein
MPTLLTAPVSISPSKKILGRSLKITSCEATKKLTLSGNSLRPILLLKIQAILFLMPEASNMNSPVSRMADGDIAHFGTQRTIFGTLRTLGFTKKA